jgi:GMP synthase-like glutamine amidotransferase
MTERLLVIEHGGYAPAGLLGDWAADRALAVHTVALHAGEPLPADISGYTAAVSLGSGDAAYDDTVPWLAAELSFLDRLLAAEVPVLGICFGAQALARVLGARVYRLSAPEIGWARITARCPALPEGPWLSWHYDGFDLPAGAAELGANEVSLQAFSLGPHTGVQFHPEATQPIARSWMEITNPAPDLVEPLFRDADDMWDQAAGLAPKLFSAWLDGDLASR